MSDYSKRPRIELVRILLQLAGHFNKHYCFPSQTKITQLYQAHTGQHMDRRSLNRHLGGLERDGWIIRERRHCRGKNGRMEMHSTMYSFGRRAVRAAKSMALALAFFTGSQAAIASNLPCANSGSISVSTKQIQGSGARSSPPDTPQKDRSAEFRELKQLLRRK